MFTHFRTQGFILKKEDRGEADRLFTFFSKDYGKLDLLARAERKISSKLRSGLEIFYLSEIEFIQGKRQKTLTDAILMDGFPNLRKSFARLRVAYSMSEVLDKLVRGEEIDLDIWNLLEEIFGKLNEKSIKFQYWYIVYYYFLWNLLSFLGYQLNLHACSLCQNKLKPGNIFFGIEDGGLVCDYCEGKTKSAMTINPDTIKILRIFLKRDFNTLKRLKIKKEDLKQLADISESYLSDVLEKTQ
ncbi:MAG: DNA repair protein RecO [Candidatus Nealsonbacteria bacterium]